MVFEKFNKSAVMAVLNAQCVAVKYRTNYVGLPHLVVALAMGQTRIKNKELTHIKDTVASSTLKRLGITPEIAQKHLMVQKSDSVAVEIPFTKDAKTVIRATEQIAAATNPADPQIGTAELLLSNLRFENGALQQLLRTLAISDKSLLDNLSIVQKLTGSPEE